MRILRNPEQGTFTIFPIGEDEQKLVATLLPTLTPLDVLKYRGRTEREGESMKLSFEHHGKVLLEFGASDEESADALGMMRDMCFFGTGALVFLNETSVDGASALSCTGGFCKSCSQPMIGISAGEDAMCKTCSDTKCVHEYEPTVFLSPAFGGLVATDACVHCHRMSDESFERLKVTPKIKRLEEATAFMRGQGIGFDLYLGGPGRPFGMTLEDAVALRDSGTIPQHLESVAKDDPVANELFKRLAEDMRTRM